MKKNYENICAARANEVFLELSKQAKTISLAESCTGGLLAYQFARIAGVSSVFLGAVVSYSAHSKMDILGVPREVISKFTPYSNEVVECMLEGALATFGADFAIATSGVAGPSTGLVDLDSNNVQNSKSVRVGDVFIGAKSRTKDAIIIHENFSGSRESVQIKACVRALELMRNYI